MNKPLNHECVICGEMYNCCDNCDDIKSFTPWRTVCDTLEHYQIYMILHDVNANITNFADAKTQLLNIGITAETIKFKNLKSTVSKQLSEILQYSADVIQPVLHDVKQTKYIAI